jgi:xanthine dehydrogenase iron-sulfur cluster and FAD-binding subunit A
VTVGPTAHDGEIEALVVDRYLESLLSREPLDEGDIPADVLTTARRLASGVRRYHPSFRFEEDLAARLAAMASERTGRLIEFPIVATRAVVAGDERAAAVRPVVIGGVLTSAALSIAGAAYVAWRRGRPPANAMTRAVRAVARARTS